MAWLPSSQVGRVFRPGVRKRDGVIQDGNEPPCGAVAEWREPVAVQASPTSPTRAEGSDRRRGRGMQRASRGAGVPDVADASGMERPATRSRNAASQSGCRGRRRRQRERNGATGDAVAECSELVGVQGSPTSPMRAEWSDRRRGRGMQRASRGAGVPDVANASGMERPAERSRNGASQSGCRGPRRSREEANGARWPSRSSKSVASRVEREGWVRLPGASATTGKCGALP